MPPVLEARSITKKFDSFVALDSVDFDLNSGEIHALLGENGAGKSTLMNVLSGALTPSSGEIVLDGKATVWHGPQEATGRGGIAMVHQHFELVPVFTVAENLTLSTQRSGFMLKQREVIIRATELSSSLGWRLDMTARAGDLPVGTQQRVEILKALLLSPRVLFFDEPTAVLTPAESDELFVVLRKLRDQGSAVVFVSHKLGEVMALCDRVTILRRGKVTGKVAIAETSPEDLAKRMVGEEVDVVRSDRIIAASDGEVQKPALAVANLSAKAINRDDVKLDDISFIVAPGEILGIAGVDGNGQTELFEALIGVRPFHSASLHSFQLDGNPILRPTPSKLLAMRVAWIPPDRRREGLAQSLSVERNLTLSLVREKSSRFGPFVRVGAIRKIAKKWITDFDIRVGSPDSLASSLSGGNQQKIVIARALARQPKLLIAASPTRGLDVGAASYVHRKLLEARSAGAGIVLISTDLDEIRAIADRIAVLYEGRIIGMVSPDSPLEEIGLLMGGKAFAPPPQ
jgi:simple sugar transport system ATP-binding protein